MNSIKELEQLKKEIESREREKQNIERDIEKLKRTMETKLRRIAGKMGCDLVPMNKSTKDKPQEQSKAIRTIKKRRPAKIKYRSGDNTWTGRGLKPLWVKEIIASGKKLENFLID